MNHIILLLLHIFPAFKIIFRNLNFQGKVLWEVKVYIFYFAYVMTDVTM